MFSIVIPLYNKSSSIGATIDSVLAQTYTDFELIVVNDGSSDNSAAIVEAYNDKRIRLLNKQNGGVSSARNWGIRHATRPYVAFLDADDLWNKEYLFKMNGFIQQYPECDIYASSYVKQIEGKLYPPNKQMLPVASGIIDNYFTLQRTYFYPFVWTSAVCIKREKLIAVGMFDEKLSLGEDLDVWYRIILTGKLAYLNEPLAIYCETPDERLTARLNVNRDILFHLDKYHEFEQKNSEFKRYLDKYRLESLRQYYIAGSDKRRVKEILGKINREEFGLFYNLYYKIIPLPVLRSVIGFTKYLRRRAQAG